MTWFKVDDGILDNPKVASAGPIGFALHVAALAYCSRNLTDGFVPYGTAPRLLGTAWAEGVDEGGVARVYSLAAVADASREDGPELIDRMIRWVCAVGLWEVVPGGYLVHDYLQYNRSRADVLAEREQQRAAGRASAEARLHRSGTMVPKNASNDPTAERPAERSVQRNPERPSEQIKSPEYRVVNSVSPNGATETLVETATRIFQMWRESVGRNGLKLTPKRQRCVAARLREGYLVADLEDAVRGWVNDPWSDRPNANEMHILLRDGAQVEKFRDLWRNGKPLAGRQRAQATELDTWLELSGEQPLRITNGTEDRT